MFFRRKPRQSCDYCATCEARIKRLHEEVAFLATMLDRSLGKLQAFHEEMCFTHKALNLRLDQLTKDVESLRAWSDRGDQADG